MTPCSHCHAHDESDFTTLRWHYTPSAEIESAIHLDNLARDEARLLRGEEAAHARNVVRLRQPPEWSLCDGRLLDGRRPLGGHRRLDHAGADGIHAYTLRAKRLGQGMREPDDSAL